MDNRCEQTETNGVYRWKRWLLLGGLLLLIGTTALVVGRGVVSAEILQSPDLFNSEQCYATHDDGTTVHISADASAISRTLVLASPQDTVKIAGTCRGVHTRMNTFYPTDPYSRTLLYTQTVYIDQSMTLEGGHTPANWQLPPDSERYPTVLDAIQSGRGIMIFNDNRAESIDVEINHLTIRNGVGSLLVLGFDGEDASGGGVATDGLGEKKISIRNVTLTDNSATVGGGIFANALFEIHNSTFVSNSAYFAAAVMGFGEVVITQSDFMHNLRSMPDEGGAAVGVFGRMTVEQSRFVENQTGGIGNSLFGRLQIDHTEFIRNKGAGAISSAGPLTVRDSLFVDNQSNDNGGAIHSIDALTITGSTFVGNSAENNGGALYTTYDDGPFGSSARPTIITVENSTFSNNSAAQGGGIYNRFAKLHLAHTTVVSNAATTGAGIASLTTGDRYQPATLTTLTTIRSSLVNGNGGGGFDIEIAPFWDEQVNSVRSDGHNVIGTVGEHIVLTSTTDLRNVLAPQVATLADNGGPTPTHALLDSSVAIEQVDAANCALHDQRGYWRPFSGPCDAGAFEADFFIPKQTFLPQINAHTNRLVR